MRKPFFLFFFIAFSCTLLQAQISLMPFGGYTFDDKFNVGGVTGKLKGAGHWGVALEYKKGPYTGFELMYQRIDSEVPFTFIGIEERKVDVALNYIMAGGTRYLPANDMIWPYGGGSLGMAIISTDNDSSTKFAWMFKAGVLIKPTGKVGIKLQAQLNSIVQGMGGGLYFGTGGSGINLDTYSTIYQFGLTGGLVIRFGQEPEPKPRMPQGVPPGRVPQGVRGY